MAPPPPHPSSLPNLALIYLIATDAIPLALIDSVVEHCLGLVYEARPASSLEAWLTRLAGIEPRIQSVKLAREIKESMANLSGRGLDGVHGWMNELKSLVPLDDDESNIATTPLHRSSPLGLYLRRTRMRFAKLDFDTAAAWWITTQAWFEGTWKDKDSRTPKDKAADAFERAMAANDYQAARDALSYYDLDQAHDSKPQHALLSLALLEFEHGGWHAALEALTESVQVARNAADADCLVACASLHKRLAAAAPSGLVASSSSPLAVGDGRPSPTDLLWDAAQSYGAGAPLSSLFTNLYASRALWYAPPILVNEHRGDKEKEKDRVREGRWADGGWEAGWHASAAGVWAGLGSATLAELRDEVALEAVGAGRGGWDVRLAVLERRAMQLARADRAEDGLSLLLGAVETAERRRGMGLPEFARWQSVVWQVVRAQVGRNEQIAVLDRLDRLSPLAPLTTPQRAALGPEDQDADAGTLYRRGRGLLDASHPVQALPFLLQAHRLARISGQVALKLRCLFGVLAVRVALSPAAAEAERGLAELEGVWGEVLAVAEGEGEEILAEAEELRGRLGVGAAGEGDDARVVRALAPLRHACDIFTSLHCRSPAQRVLLLLARLYDHLSLGAAPPPAGEAGWVAQRDGAAARYLEAEEVGRKEAGWGAGGDEWSGVRDVVEGVRRAVLAEVVGAEGGKHS